MNIFKKRRSKVNETVLQHDKTRVNFSKKVPLKIFENYVKSSWEMGLLAEQHKKITELPNKNFVYGSLPENINKDRYKQIIAYDDTRVILEKNKEDPYSDYINANYINGYNCENAYIATQAPKQSTIHDFWRMIWQKNVKYIVTIGKLFETGQVKGEKYWPTQQKNQNIYEFTIQFTCLETYADFECRTFVLIWETDKGKKIRTIKQYHFLSWPDHGVPLYPQSLVTFLTNIILRIPYNSNSPIVVHCSAGVGRTGTIILCDICLRMANFEGELDPLKYIYQMRQNRTRMVDNLDQYVLVHLVLIECLLSPIDTIPCYKLDEVFKQLDNASFKIQLLHIQQKSWQDSVASSNKEKKTTCDKSKNRFQDITATEGRVNIPIGGINSIYINAVQVDGFKVLNQYIVTQIPLPNTVVDFWHMILYKKCKVIISLNEIPCDTTCCQFWPENLKVLPLNKNITLIHISTEDNESYCLHNIALQKEVEKINVTILQYKNWKFNVLMPKNIQAFIHFWDTAEMITRGKHPTVITCYNGATASGLYVALSFIIEKMKLEQEFDPYLALRIVRRNRQQFVTHTEQLEFLYSAAIEYLEMFENYSNFQY